MKRPRLRFHPTQSDTGLAVLAGALGELYLVGGYVRDHLLAREKGPMATGAAKQTRDVDLATPHPPDEVIRRLATVAIKTEPVGLRHGTVLAVIGKRTYEITSFRKDITTDGRHAQVEFGGTLDTDAHRRDFTVNALYATMEGDVLDPTGFGLRDLHARILRFVGEPEQRIQEDLLRILRLYRLQAELDFAPIDAGTSEAVSRQVSGLSRLSPERVNQELRRLLVHPASLNCLEQMQAGGVFSALTDWEFTSDDVSAHRWRRWPALVRAVAHAKELLLQDTPLASGTLENETPAGDQRNLRMARVLHWGCVATGLGMLFRGTRSPEQARLTKAEGAAVRWIRSHTPQGQSLFCSGFCSEADHPNHPKDPLVEDWRQRLWPLSAPQTVLSLLVDVLDTPAPAQKLPPTLAQTFVQVLQWERPQLPLSGHDIQHTLGLKGPAVGQALHRARALFCASGFTLQKSALLAKLRPQ